MKHLYTLLSQRLKKAVAIFAAVCLIIGVPVKSMAQVPVISYSSPQVFVVANAITTLLPASTNVAPLAYGNSAVSIGSGFSNPYGVAVDASENVFVADNGHNAVKRIAGGTGTITTLGTGLVSPIGVAVDVSENVFVTNSGTYAVVEIPGNGGSEIPVLTNSYNFTFAAGIAVDAIGDLFVVDQGANTVMEITTFGTTISIGYGYHLPIGVAVDANGYIYIADNQNNAIKEITNGVDPVIIGSGFSIPTGVVADGAGNVFVADQGNNAVKEIPGGSGAPVTIGAGFNAPFGIAFSSGTGNLYVGDSGNNAVKKIAPVGGYFISPALPAGLTFNNFTGAISGTALYASPATNYTITAYNAAGSATAMINITVRSVPPAIISYSSPQKFSVGTTITPLTPVTTGVATLGYNATSVPYGSGFSNPFNISFDAAGNMYVADFLNNAVKEVPAGNGAPITLGTGFNRPTGVVVDKAGNIYVDDSGNNLIKEILSGSNTPVIYGSGFGSPQSLTIDGSGDLFFLDMANSQVKEIPVGGGAAVVIKSGFSNDYGLTIDVANNIYVADATNNEIEEFPAAGGATTVVGYLQNGGPEGVAVDAAGNVYIAYTNDNSVSMFPAGGGTAINIGSGYGGPTGIAVDPSGVVYVADANSSIEKIVPTGGYYLNQPLPPGLSFSNSTGTISGTPTAISPATNYTVTAYNAGGPSSTTVNLDVTLFPLSYGTAQTFNTGVAITPIVPVSSGVGAPAFSAPVTLATNLVNPVDVAVDAAGNTYVAGFKDLYKITPAGAVTSSTLGISPTPGGYVQFQGIAIDKLGNLYISSGDTFDVYKVPAGSNTAVIFASGFSNPTSVGVDNAGNVYVLDRGSNLYVEEFPVVGGAPIVLARFSNSLSGIAVDGPGNVFVTSGAGYYKIHPGGAVIDTITSGIHTDYLAVDPSGNVYATTNGKVIECPPGGGYNVIAAGGVDFFFTAGLRADGAGHVYELNYNDPNSKFGQDLTEINPQGGYYINPVLPAGLSFNSATGVISGTPTAASPATTYTITAYNSNGGSSTATISITVNLVNPTVTYSSPQTFYIGQAISPALAPASSAVSPPGYSNTQVFLDAINYRNMSADLAGNVYVVGYYNHFDVGVFKIPPGGAPILLASYLDSGPVPVPTAVTADAAGNIYYTTLVRGTSGNGTLYKIPAGGNVPVPISSASFYNPTSMATDAAGNVYIADYNNVNYYIVEFPAGSTTGTIINTSAISDLSVDMTVNGAGDLYLPSGAHPMFIYKLSKATGHVDTIKTDMNGQGIAVDGAGNIYRIGQFGIYRFPAGGGASQLIAANHQLDGNGAGITYALGVSVDASGNVYAGNNANNHPSNGYDDIEKITPNGGYFISPSIPAGISFNNATGVINGTPTGLSPPTNYTVTAYNNYGGVTTQTINMQVVTSANANLANLALSSGALSPAFAGANTSYTAAVSNTIASITVTPTAVDILAPITVNGTTIASGKASPAINLNIGANVINTVVTSQDGTTTKTYTVTVTRAAPSVDILVNLAIGVPLSPTFTYTTVSYTANVPNTTTSVKATPSSPAGYVETIKINGTTVASGTASGAIALNVGANTITTVVTAQDGVSTKTYTVTITRAPSSVATLAGLKTSSGTLTPTFAPGTISYTASVTNTTTSITVTPTTTGATATVKVNGTAVTSGSPSGAIALSVGANTITTVVAAQDGTTTKTYTVTVIRAAASNNAYLATINLTPAASLTVVSGPDYKDYTASEPNTTSSVTVTFTTHDPTATVKVNGTTVASGTPSGAIALSVGPNAITIVSTAQDGTTTKTYGITVTRVSSSPASLSALQLSSGTLTPVFATATTSYTASVLYAASTITVTPTTSVGTATIKVNGTTVASGAASGPIALSVGSNTITTVVTNGASTKTYTVTVTRAAASNNAYLATINLTPAASLTVVSGPDYKDYTASVPNTTSSVTVTFTTHDPTATVKVNGTTVASGTPSGAIALSVGPNTITIVSTAQDGVTAKTYGIAVTRMGPVNIPDATVSVSSPTNSPTLAEEVVVVHAGVSPNGDGINDFFQIDGILAYPDNKLMIMNRNGMLVYEAKGYDNSSRIFDGHSNKTGQLQLPGTYFYSLDYTVNGITKHKTGFLVLKY